MLTICKKYLYSKKAMAVLLLYFNICDKYVIKCRWMGFFVITTHFRIFIKDTHYHNLFLLLAQLLQ